MYAASSIIDVGPLTRLSLARLSVSYYSNLARHLFLHIFNGTEVVSQTPISESEQRGENGAPRRGEKNP